MEQKVILAEQRKKDSNDKIMKVMTLISRHSKVNHRLVLKAGICEDRAEAENLLDSLVKDKLLTVTAHKGRGPATKYYTKATAPGCY